MERQIQWHLDRIRLITLTDQRFIIGDDDDCVITFRYGKISDVRYKAKRSFLDGSENTDLKWRVGRQKFVAKLTNNRTCPNVEFSKLFAWLVTSEASGVDWQSSCYEQPAGAANSRSTPASNEGARRLNAGRPSGQHKDRSADVKQTGTKHARALGLSGKVPRQQIVASYWELVKGLHPDTVNDRHEELKAFATKRL